MTRFGTVLFFFGMLCVCGVSLAQSSALPAVNPAVPKIVTLNFNAVVLGTAEAQRELSTMQKKYAPREQELQRLNDDVESSKKLLSDSAGKISETEKERRVLELSSKDKQLQRSVEDLKNDSQTEGQQVFQRVAQKVYAFLQEYSAQHGYTAVLERGTETAPVVWYTASNVDITDEVVKAYNAKSALPDLPANPRPTQAAPAKHP